ncbi:MAG: methyltransferase protein, partial [Frankiales bacterium]|nr:methyltransferase protein [Frankiales bacterium]
MLGLMEAPKYDTEVDVSNENMSQTLLALLVGEGQTVLDVGCATGYTASVLRARGCRVDGIEYDPSVAQEAAKHVDRLEVGDVQAMDLVGLFGAASYDAIVFGDVLEHLTQPEAVLRACLPLLKPGGAIVASIPNVAHGAVRLALLKGRFAYTSTGLLDETHVRFFTRDTVLGMFDAAGYAVVDLRRTRLGVFETEVRVAEGDYPAAFIAEVSADPEATTYQFVLRAVPSAAADPAAVQAVADAEALRLPSIVKLEAATPPTTLPAVPSARLGLWGSWDLDDVSQAVLGRVLSAEISRRLPGVLLRFAAPYGASSRSGLGEPVEELGPIGAVRSSALAEGLDAALVVGPVDTSEAVLAARYARAPRQDDPTRHLLQGPTGVPVLWGPVTFDGSGWVSLAPGAAPGAETRALPDPGVLASRVQSLAEARRRTAYLRSAGWLALSPRIVAVHLSGDTDVAPVIAALRELTEADTGLSICALELDTTSGDGATANAISTTLQSKALLCPVDAGVDSHLAVLAVADLVISTSSTARAIAASYGVPSLDPSDLSTAAAALAGRDRRRAVSSQVVADQAALDAWFEEVAEHVRKAVAPADERAVLSTAERYAALEKAHAAMRARTSTEVLHAAESVPALEIISRDQGPEIDALRREIHALNNTRTMRALKP